MIIIFNTIIINCNYYKLCNLFTLSIKNNHINNKYKYYIILHYDYD